MCWHQFRYRDTRFASLWGRKFVALRNLLESRSNDSHCLCNSYNYCSDHVFRDLFALVWHRSRGQQTSLNTDKVVNRSQDIVVLIWLAKKMASLLKKHESGDLYSLIGDNSLYATLLVLHVLLGSRCHWLGYSWQHHVADHSAYTQNLLFLLSWDKRRDATPGYWGFQRMGLVY